MQTNKKKQFVKKKCHSNVKATSAYLYWHNIRTCILCTHTYCSFTLTNHIWSGNRNVVNIVMRGHIAYIWGYCPASIFSNLCCFIEYCEIMVLNVQNINERHKFNILVQKM